MANHNSQHIINASQKIDEPATGSKIVNYIAVTSGVVKESVMETLKGGVLFGYVQRWGRKYFLNDRNSQPGLQRSALPVEENTKEDIVENDSMGKGALEDDIISDRRRRGSRGGHGGARRGRSHSRTRRTYRRTNRRRPSRRAI